MSENIQEVLEELHTVRPDMLDEKGKRLFEAIMKIVDERDKYKGIIKEVREYANTDKNCVPKHIKDYINDLLDKENK